MNVITFSKLKEFSESIEKNMREKYFSKYSQISLFKIVVFVTIS